MKVSAKQAGQFRKKLSPEMNAVLLHGPDSGLVRELGQQLVQAVAGNPPDPFRISDISAKELRKTPSLLMDEASAIPFTGGAKIVRIRETGEQDCKLLKTFLTDSIGGCLVVAEAGELRASSALKRLFEGATDAASIACYQDEPRDIIQMVQAFGAEHNLEINKDALSYLVANLGADRMITRAELEKLLLYSGEGATVTEADAAAIVGDNAAYSLNHFAVKIADGHDLHLERTWTNLRLQGITPVQALRTTLNHFQRLHYVVTGIAKGHPPGTSIKSLRPPVHFSVRDAFQRQVAMWNAERLNRAMTILIEAEQANKQTGDIGEVTAKMACLRIYNAAKSLRNHSSPSHHH